MAGNSEEDGGMSGLSKIYATDETFREVADLLFGAGADELIHKMNPAQSDLSTSGDPKKRKAAYTAAMGANTVAAVGGVHALGMSLTHEGLPGNKKLARGVKAVKDSVNSTKAGRGYLKAAKNPRVAAGIGAGWVGLHGVELGADISGRHALKQNYKNSNKVQKSAKEIVEQVSSPNPRGKLTQVAMGKAKDSKFIKCQTGKLKTLPGKVSSKVAKSEAFDITWKGEISKVDADKRQVFGWASIVEVNGEPVVDLQGDYIALEEIEKSAYSYVQKSRKGGDMHRRNGADPHHVSDMIESFVVTPEKKEKLGLPDEMPTGWWVGYQVHDDDTWDLVKSGKRTGFSIHGSGTRKAMD